MPKLILIKDFPTCSTYEVKAKGATNTLIDKCREYLRDQQYWFEEYMFCVISDGEDWMVLHPVVSNLKGGTMHPMEKRGHGSWNWLSGINYSADQRSISHQKFTQLLRESLKI